MPTPRTVTETLKQVEIFIEFPICYGFLQHIAFLSFITMANEVPELYIKTSVFTVVYMPKGNHVKTL